MRDRDSLRVFTAKRPSNIYHRKKRIKTTTLQDIDQEMAFSVWVNLSVLKILSNLVMAVFKELLMLKPVIRITINYAASIKKSFSNYLIILSRFACSCVFIDCVFGNGTSKTCGWILFLYSPIDATMYQSLSVFHFHCSQWTFPSCTTLLCGHTSSMLHPSLLNVCKSLSILDSNVHWTYNWKSLYI